MIMFQASASCGRLMLIPYNALANVPDADQVIVEIWNNSTEKMDAVFLCFYSDKKQKK